MASCKAEFENIKLAVCTIAAQAWTAGRTRICYFFWSFFTCCIIWVSTLASNTKHNQYHRGHNTIKDKEKASIACWYRNLKGIRYCPLILEANSG